MGSELMLMCAGVFLDVIGKLLFMLFMVATWLGSVLDLVVFLCPAAEAESMAALEPERYLGSVAPLFGGEPNMPCSVEGGDEAVNTILHLLLDCSTLPATSSNLTVALLLWQ